MTQQFMQIFKTYTRRLEKDGVNEFDIRDQLGFASAYELRKAMYLSRESEERKDKRHEMFKKALELSKSGMSNKEVADALGINKHQLFDMLGTTKEEDYICRKIQIIVEKLIKDGKIKPEWIKEEKSEEDAIFESMKRKEVEEAIKDLKHEKLAAVNKENVTIEAGKINVPKKED